MAKQDSTRISDLEKAAAASEANYGHTRTQLTDLYEKVEQLVKVVATKNDVKEIIKEHQKWEEQSHKQYHDQCDADRKQLNKRVSALERWKWMIVGGGAAIGFLVNKFSKFL